MKSPPDRLAHAVHISLLIGSAASALLFVLGLIIALTTGQARPLDPPKMDRTLLESALHANAVAILELGLLILLLTPLLRIAVLAIGWSIRRDLRFALVAIVVLSLLGASLRIGMG